MNGQSFSSSYPPAINMSSIKHSRARPRKNPHPLTTRSLPLLQYSDGSDLPHSSGFGTLRLGSLGSTYSAPCQSFSLKSKPHIPTVPDQVVPLDFSVRHSKKRSNIVAFKSNESDTENLGAASSTTLATTTDPDVNVAAQLLQNQYQATLNEHLRAQLQIFFNLQQQQLNDLVDEPENSTDKIGGKKQRQDFGRNETELQWADLYTTVMSPSTSTSARAIAYEQKSSRKKNNVNGVQVGSGRSNISGAAASTRSIAIPRRRSNATGKSSDSAQQRPRAQTQQRHRAQTQQHPINGAVRGNEEVYDSSRQQIFVNYQFFIDEHFRRSLGNKKYRELFPSRKSSRNPSTTSTDEEDDEEPVQVQLD